MPNRKKINKSLKNNNYLNFLGQSGFNNIYLNKWPWALSAL